MTGEGRLFAACRAGHVAVSVARLSEWASAPTSSARGGVAPPRLPVAPSDIAQREGRILRQGNQNPEVQICRYVMEGALTGTLADRRAQSPVHRPSDARQARYP